MSESVDLILNAEDNASHVMRQLEQQALKMAKAFERMNDSPPIPESGRWANSDKYVTDRLQEITQGASEASHAATSLTRNLSGAEHALSGLASAAQSFGSPELAHMSHTAEFLVRQFRSMNQLTAENSAILRVSQTVIGVGVFAAAVSVGKQIGNWLWQTEMWNRKLGEAIKLQQQMDQQQGGFVETRFKQKMKDIEFETGEDKTNPKYYERLEEEKSFIERTTGEFQTAKKNLASAQAEYDRLSLVDPIGKMTGGTARFRELQNEIDHNKQLVALYQSQIYQIDQQSSAWARQDAERRKALAQEKQAAIERAQNEREIQTILNQAHRDTLVNLTAEERYEADKVERAKALAEFMQRPEATDEQKDEYRQSLDEANRLQLREIEADAEKKRQSAAEKIAKAKVNELVTQERLLLKVQEELVAATQGKQAAKELRLEQAGFTAEQAKMLANAETFAETSLKNAEVRAQDAARYKEAATQGGQFALTFHGDKTDSQKVTAKNTKLTADEMKTANSLLKEVNAGLERVDASVKALNTGVDTLPGDGG